MAMEIILDEGMLYGLCHLQIERMVFTFLFVLFNGTIVFLWYVSWILTILNRLRHVRRSEKESESGIVRR